MCCVRECVDAPMRGARARILFAGFTASEYLLLLYNNINIWAGGSVVIGWRGFMKEGRSGWR